MSRTGDWIIELMEKGEWEENPHQYDYSPHDYATSQSEWASVFGQAIGLIYQVLQEQRGTGTMASTLYHTAEKLSVDVIAHKRELSLREAYVELGYEMPKPVEGIPF